MQCVEASGTFETCGDARFSAVPYQRISGVYTIRPVPWRLT
jgi:hypothetical protein